jgi:V/A-type H+-transporting ATPase subunit K
MIQPETAKALVALGAFCSFGLAALGSAIGCGLAAASAIGAWKRCYAQGKPAPFQLTILTGVPMSQTFYGMVLMNSIVAIQPQYWLAALVLGLLGGLGIGASAAYQGRAAAGACDSFAETNQGFANNLLALGVVETIAIFVMVFGRMFIGKIGA